MENKKENINTPICNEFFSNLSDEFKFTIGINIIGNEKTLRQFEEELEKLVTKYEGETFDGEIEDV